MSLKLFDRIATLLKADAHGVVESLEERSLLLKQYVREAEIELNRKRAELEALRDEEKRLRESLTRREEESRALDEDISLALAGGKDDLARFAIRRL
jgi:phage shock protein A